MEPGRSLDCHISGIDSSSQGNMSNPNCPDNPSEVGFYQNLDEKISEGHKRCPKVRVELKRPKAVSFPLISDRPLPLLPVLVITNLKASSTKVDCGFGVLPQTCVPLCQYAVQNKNACPLGLCPLLTLVWCWNAPGRKASNE